MLILKNNLKNNSVYRGLLLFLQKLKLFMFIDDIIKIFAFKRFNFLRYL